MEDEEKEPKEGEQDDGAKPELGDAGKRALDAERKARRTAEKELGELKARLKEIEDEGKSELEKLREQVAEWKSRAEKAEADSLRNAIAAAKGLTMAQARRLVGATKEELEADADALLEDLGLKKNEDDGKEGKDDEEIPQDEKPLGRPQENLKPGASNEGAEEPDASKLADSILKSPY